MNDRKIKVIGSGISGLSCAVALQEAGFHVSIVAADKPERTTSAAAAGIWMPFHAGDNPRTGIWTKVTYDYCRAMQADPRSGVFFIEHGSYFRSGSPEIAEEIRAADGFRILSSEELKYGARTGFSLRLPIMPAEIFLPFLAEQFVTSGGSFSWRKIHDLSEETGDCDLLVNCTGYGARALCGDDAVDAAKGHVIVVANPGLRHNAVVSDGDIFTHIFPFGDQCVLGGIYQPGNIDLTPDPLVTQDILARAAALEPSLRDADILGERTGLRPLRSSIRLETETLAGGGRVIHNYGHGGAGYTVARGCAEDVAALAFQLLF